MATPKLEPVFAIAYGPSKRGKTVDCLYSFPNALKIAAPGALKPAEWIGIPQPYVEKTRILVDDIKVLNALVDKIEVKPKRPGEFAACLVDDFSLMAEATFSKLEKNLSGFKLWGALRDLILELRDKGRRKGIHMIFNAHESGARTYQGRFIRGGPKLPGSLPEDFPAACDMVLRAVEDPARSLGWKGAYQCSNIRSDFITGDRHGAAYDLCPMNLGEILRYAGFVLPRLEGMDWAENAVEQISQALEPAFMSENFDKAREINRNAVAQLAQFDPKLVNWALRDAIDRAAIRVAHRKSIHSMFA